MFTELTYMFMFMSNGKKKENRVFDGHRLDV